MQVLIEFDGVIADTMSLLARLYQDAARAVGWAPADDRTFRRQYRTRGREANLLAGARPRKLEEMWQHIDAAREQEDAIATIELHGDLVRAIDRIARHSQIGLVTLGANIDARRARLREVPWMRHVASFERLHEDPRRRPGELTILSEGDSRCVAVCGGDALVRSTREANLFAVGLTCGTCHADRLQQAGVDIVYRDLGEVADSISRGAPDMVKAGLLPLRPQ